MFSKPQENPSVIWVSLTGVFWPLGYVSLNGCVKFYVSSNETMIVERIAVMLGSETQKIQILLYADNASYGQKRVRQKSKQDTQSAHVHCVMHAHVLHVKC